MLVLEMRGPRRTTESHHGTEVDALNAACDLQRPLLVAGWLEVEYTHEGETYHWQYDHPLKPGVVEITITPSHSRQS